MIYLNRARALSLGALLLTCSLSGISPYFSASGQSEPASAKAEKTLDPTGLPEIWLQGTPIKSFEKDTFYVFECWATWCGPCIAAMPHMESLHKHFEKNPKIIIAGFNVWDTPKPEELKKFLAKLKTKVTYPIATDGSRSGSVAQKWLKPMGVSGIPFAMFVKNGKVLWSGHPADITPQMIELYDKDPQAAQKQANEVQAKENAEKATRSQILGALSKNDIDQAAKIISQITDPDIENIYPFWAHGLNFLRQTGRWEQIPAYLNAWANWKPEDKKTQFLVASRLIGLEETASNPNNLKLAKACIEKHMALAGDTANHESWELLGDILQKEGKKDEAKKAYQKAMSMHPYQKEIEALSTSK